MLFALVQFFLLTHPGLQVNDTLALFWVNYLREIVPHDS